MKRDSFTQQVKEEICSIDCTDKQFLALLSGFVKTNAVYTTEDLEKTINLSTENSKIAKLLYKGFNQLFKVVSSFVYQKKMKLDKCVVYHVIVKEQTYPILKSLQLFDGDEALLPRELLEDDGLRYFISGVFLASGSVNSPSSSNYHLQMIVDTEQDAKFLLKLLNRFRKERNMDFKIISRRKKYIVYLKKADQIATFLAAVNASRSVLDFENVRIEKDFINSDNRYQICLTANYQRTLKKAQEEIHDIEVIEAKLGLKNLDEKQRAIAIIRKNNIDIPLSQIVDMLLDEYKIKTSKSSVSRTFDALHELALHLEGK